MKKRIVRIWGHKVLLSLFAIMLFSGWYFTRDVVKITYDTTSVKRGNIVQEVSLTGRVESEYVTDLAFERGGKVATEPRPVGVYVKRGDTLVRLDTREIETLRAQASANLDYEIAKIAELKKGTRDVDIIIYKSHVESAQATLIDAETALEDKLKSALTTADDSVFNKTDHLFENPRTTNPRLSFPVSDLNLIGQIESARFILTTMIKDINSVNDVLEGRLTRDKLYFIALKDYFDQLAEAINALLASSAYPQTTINSWKGDVSLARTNLNSAFTGLLAAEQAYRSAGSALTIAKNELASKEAGPTPESISAQEARIASVRATIANYDAQIAKSIIIAPFSGVVTRQQAKLGETITPNTSIVSLIGDTGFKIIANAPEVDIAKLVTGQDARVTLDAHGSDIQFPAVVSMIDPSETIIQGVSTYKVTLRFKEKDERIRSGMTANIDISTAKRENVLFVPSRSVVARDGKKYIRIPDGPSMTKETEITTGLRGSDGSIEIVSGVVDGDTIVTFEQKK